MTQACRTHLCTYGIAVIRMVNMIIINESETPLFQKRCGSEFGESIIETNELWNLFDTTGQSGSFIKAI